MSKISAVAVAAFAITGVVGCGDLHADASHSHSHSESPADSNADPSDSTEEAHSHGDHHDEDMRRADAHSHGEAKLAFALDENVLYIELDTPLYNLTGFEYTPRTPDEVETQKRAEALLAQPGRLFSVNAEAECSPRNPDEGVRLSSITEHEGHAHDGPGHDEEHAEADTEPSGTHRDFVIEYAVECRAPDRIDEIVVHLFEFFPRFEELESVYLDQSTQHAARLTPASNRIRLAR